MSVESPMYDVPTDINFHKTVIAGYPSGDNADDTHADGGINGLAHQG